LKKVSNSISPYYSSIYSRLISYSFDPSAFRPFRKTITS
jgi:hypothetical protein